MRKISFYSTSKAFRAFLILCLLSCQVANGQAWVSMANFAAEDISVGKGGVVWATGKDGNVYRWTGLSWENMKWPGTRIAVDVDGSAWAIHPKGYIYKYNATTGKFDAMADQAIDIAIGANGSIWKIGINKTGNDYDIYQWNGTNWTNVPGGAVRIAVDPSGKAWVVNSAGTVYSYENAGWTQRPGSVKDIAVGANGSMWCTALDGGIYQWDGNNWVLKTGAAVNISVTPDGNPWVVNSAGTVWRVGPANTIQSRSIFPNRDYWEQRVIGSLMKDPKQLDPNFTYIPPSDLVQKALARLALNATESFYAGNTVITPENAVVQINNSSIIRNGIYGILSIGIFEELKKNGTDEQALALKSWATEIYKSMKVRIAYAILQEYEKWKRDPCSYTAEGYKRPPDCSLNEWNFATWFAAHRPPEDILVRAGMKGTLSSNADDIAAGVAVGAAACAMVAAFGILTSVMTVGAAVAEISINVALAAGIATLGIGAVGLVAAPVVAAILSVVVGTIEGFRVVEAEKIEPMLKMKLGAAMTDPINIVNTIADSISRSVFFVALQEAAIHKFHVLKRRDIKGEVRFYCQAGYVSKFKLSYTALDNSVPLYTALPKDKLYEFTTEELPVGREQSFELPYDSINIKVQGWYAAAGWKEFLNQSIAAPTFLCYTSYGTIFDAKYKTDCPEVGSMTTRPNELTVTQGGGYSAWVKLTYTQNGNTVVAQDQKGFTLGWRKVYAIPKDATNIYLLIKDATGLAWDPWKKVIEKTWPTPPNECIKVYGTTLDPKWNNECK